MITYKPLPQQHKTWEYLNDKTTTEIFYGGSAGGGKTHLLCNWVILSALKYPGTNWLIGRARFSSLLKTTYLSFVNLLNEYGLQNQVRWNGQSHQFIFKNRSIVFFQDLYQQPSDQEFNSLRGFELTGVAFDEGAEISLKAFQVLGTRIRKNLDKYNLIPKMLICSNPSKNWLYSRYYVPYRDGLLPDDIKYIKSSCEDNTYLPESYIQKLLNGPELEKQIYYYGNWEYDEKLLNLFDHEKILNSFYHKVPSGEKYLTCDVAMSGGDRTCITVWDGLNCIEIKLYNNMDTIKIVEEIKRYINKYKIKINNCIVDKIGVGTGVSDLLKGSIGYIAGNTALNNEGFSNQRSQFYYKLSEYIYQDKIHISCEPNLYDMICQELESHQKIETDTINKAKIISKDKIKQQIGRSPDISDALSMRMYFELIHNKVNLLFY